MKKVPQSFKKLVREYIQQHAWNMGVSNYQSDIHYMEKDKEDDCGDITLADCTVDRRYLRAVFKVYPELLKKWKKNGDSYLEECIAHEVAHILTAHLHWLSICSYKDEGEVKDAWESLTESIGRISLALAKLEKKS